MSANAADARVLDPLYDAQYLIFIYALWMLVGWAFGNLAGLATLVGATVVLTLGALRDHRRSEPRSFAAEFGSILLFSAAGIGIAVLLVNAIGAAPLLVLGVVVLATSVAIAGRVAWAELRTP